MQSTCHDAESQFRDRARRSCEAQGIQSGGAVPVLQKVGCGEVRGRFALRACVLDYRTTRRDIEILFDDLRRVATEVGRV